MSVIAPERMLLNGAGSASVDLGGYLTRSGELVRWRTVLRWRSPGPASVADVFSLAEAVGSAVAFVDVAVLDVGASLAALAGTPLPAVVYSTGSQERVGETVLVLLGVLGVGDDDIARHMALDGGPVDVARMRLRDIRLSHGSMSGYAFDAGVDLAVIEQLRDRLLF